MRALVTGMLWTLAGFCMILFVAVVYNRGDLPPSTHVNWQATAVFWLTIWLAISALIFIRRGH
jgi:predicted cobalt transporter CbtA